MQRSFLKCLLIAGVASLLLAFGTSAFAQGVTTSAINGFVTDKAGQPIGGATVTIVHEPSGTRSVATTRPNGQYDLSGMRVGGPYTVTASAKDLRAATQKEIYLTLSQSQEVSFTLSEEVVAMEAFHVAGTRDTIFDSNKMGVSSSLSDQDLSNLSSVRRNVQDAAVLDSRLVLMSLDQGGQLSAQGQNFRFNSFLVDGVQAVDPFGLNSNGFSSLRSPIPFEAIQTLNIDLSPYDARYAGFTGALLNAVTKSGTNELHGSAYYEYSDQSLRQKNPVTKVVEPFRERTFGFTVGGPIVKNKLFYFLDYDDFKRTAAPPQTNFIPDATQLAAIVARAQSFGFNPGTMNAVNTSAQKTLIGKLDWNISDQHRASLTYRRNFGHDTSFASLGTGTSLTTSLSGTWFQQPRNTESYTAQLFSNWTSDLSSEVALSYTKYNGTPQVNGGLFPQVTINGLSGMDLSKGASTTAGTLVIGTDSSRQLNFIHTKEKNGHVIFNYSVGEHTISAGLEDISTKYENVFLQSTAGSYSFGTSTVSGSGLSAWQNGSPITSYTLQKPYAGYTINNAIAGWSYDAYALFVEDTWRPSQQLTLLYGLRYDDPHIDGAPPESKTFETAGFSYNGQSIVRSDTTNTGNATFGPRLGFTYATPKSWLPSILGGRKTQIRGGVGLFQGKNPAVWLSNAYSNAGATYIYNAATSDLSGLTFNANPATQTVPGTANPTAYLNVTDPKFKQPSMWKSNIAIDHELPYLGMTFTAEYYFNKAAEALNTVELNYRLATTGPALMPDGRIHYNAAVGTSTSSNTSTQVTARTNPATGFNDVFYLTNTNKGEASGLTLGLTRPMRKNWGWSAYWTHGRATEVSPITSSTAGSNYSNRASRNPNEDVASISNTNIKDRFVVTLTREFNFIKEFKTTLAFVYQARTGHPYSWVFRGDANGDGYAFNDLLYVPTGPNDPRVAWTSTTERDAFFNFVANTDLKNYMGSNAPRNSTTSPWNQTLDLKFTQEIPLSKKVHSEIYFDFLNLPALINQKLNVHWFPANFGYLEEIPFSYRRGVASASYNATANGGQGQWTYNFNSSTLDAVPITVNDTPASRWQVQMGVRIRF